MDLGHQVLILFTYVLAVARLTRLINADMILDRLRLIPAYRLHEAKEAVMEAALHGQSAQAAVLGKPVRRWATVVEFLECPWCVGMWVALATAAVPIQLIGWPWWTIVPVTLAASHLVGVFAFAASTEDIEIVKGDV